MRIITFVLIIFLVGGMALAEETYLHAVGIDAGFSNLTGGVQRHPYEKSFGIRMSTYMIGKWRLEAGFVSETIYKDSAARSYLTIGSTRENRITSWKSYNAHLLCKYRFLPFSSPFSFDLGIGAGIASWEIYEAQGDTLIDAFNENDKPISPGATEVMISAATGMEYQITKDLKLDLDLQINLLTGWGQEFTPEFEADLANWNTRVSLGLSYLIGKKRMTTSDRRSGANALSRIYMESVRGDFDARRQVMAFSDGPDSDRDGIPDRNDLCPETSSKAVGMVDINGCAIDTDCDGLPNYADACPYNPIGARVDSRGCPVDSDNDGVPDGIDDCPNSPPSLKVDGSGCIDIDLLRQPMIMHIQYESGSFEIDYKHKKIIEDLSKLLIKAKVIKVEINGYTDNIGAAEANRSLSQKRANRIRDYLIRLGVEPDRIVANGKGEVNFIASNDTRDGRSRNRRVELIFYK